MGTNHKEKKSILIYKDWYELINTLCDEDAGKFFKAIYNYVHGEDVNLPDHLKFAFIPIKTQLVRDLEKWQYTVEKRRDAGSLGGKQKVANLASASKCKQSVANLAVIDKVNVNVSDKVNVNVNDNEINIDDDRWIQKVNNKEGALNLLSPKSNEFEGFGIQLFQDINFIKADLFKDDLATARTRVLQLVKKHRKVNSEIDSKKVVTYIDDDGNKRCGKTHEIIKGDT